MLKKILIILFLLSSISLAQAVGGSITLGIPQAEFGEFVNNNAYGLSGEATIWAPSKARPFSVGMNIGYLIYGIENYTQPLSNTISRVAVDVQTTNNLFNFHLLFKVSPFSGDVRPYIDGLFGGNYFFTESTVKDAGSGSDVLSSVNLDDFSWSYGAGGGILVSLNRDRTLFLDLKGRYLWGSETEYLKRGSITEDGAGNVFYDIQQSKTDLLTIHLGVIAYIN
ncbi:MAG: hypothetical protein K9J16_04400 [Melioribacteraceae bacterium]|nr:hypothetical protein [Melioribacteraceae bacterium]MCF8354769.1 hypothetical protein [Melioribacteraceae bacterium]MCF8394394.1 hypothetical protein [Melioribacteraceae bacterium]MCF8417510.1 hypothetical protein [Melioribacteraceae bacterium]